MVKEELEKQDSYFKNKFLRFLFNSKENVSEGIFLVNIVIFVFVLLFYNFFIDFPPTLVDNLFNNGLDTYNFLDGIIILGLYLFTLLISLIEVELFEYFVKE